MSFTNGNKKDGKHYWLTPPALYKQLELEFNFDYDPCPFPLTPGFNGLTSEWGKSNYVNPPFGSFTDVDGKKKGPTAWARKAIEEYNKGKKVVFVYPIDKWVLMMLENGAEVRNLKDVRWYATEDNTQGPGTGRHVACFIFDPSKPKP
jgi:DNA N-6-adenine-methyltransferase (Dam)